MAAGQKLTPTEIRDRVRSRTSAVPTLPERPRLDAVLRDAR